MGPSFGDLIRRFADLLEELAGSADPEVVNAAVVSALELLDLEDRSVRVLIWQLGPRSLSLWPDVGRRSVSGNALHQGRTRQRLYDDRVWACAEYVHEELEVLAGMAGWPLSAIKRLLRRGRPRS